MIDCVSIAQNALQLVHPYSDFSRLAKLKIQVADDLSRGIPRANNPRDVLNRMLDLLIEAHALYEKSIFTWPLWDGNYVSPTIQRKFGKLNKICVSVAFLYYELDETNLAQDWLFDKMDCRGEYEKSSIPLFRRILGSEFDRFKEDFMDASDRYIASREEVRDELRNRPFIPF